MEAHVINAARRKSGWTQAELAVRLGVTQAYLSLMESGRRRVPPRLARRLVRLLDLPPTRLPLTRTPASQRCPTNEWVDVQLARLGYPGFAYRNHGGPLRNPKEVLLAGLAFDELDPRLVEALPWLLLHYGELGAEDLVLDVKVRDLQNRLGFTASLARQVAERNRKFQHRSQGLRLLEEALEGSRLAREETFGQGRASVRLRDWLREERSDAARHWNLLTDLKVDHLPYADDNPESLV